MQYTVDLFSNSNAHVNIELWSVYMSADLSKTVIHLSEMFITKYRVKSVHLCNLIKLCTLIENETYYSKKHFF